jgi:hypothetical protein
MGTSKSAAITGRNVSDGKQRVDEIGGQHVPLTRLAGQVVQLLLEGRPSRRAHGPGARGCPPARCLQHVGGGPLVTAGPHRARRPLRPRSPASSRPWTRSSATLRWCSGAMGMSVARAPTTFEQGGAVAARGVQPRLRVAVGAVQLQHLGIGVALGEPALPPSRGRPSSMAPTARRQRTSWRCPSSASVSSAVSSTARALSGWPSPAVPVRERRPSASTACAAPRRWATGWPARVRHSLAGALHPRGRLHLALLPAHGQLAPGRRRAPRWG